MTTLLEQARTAATRFTADGAALLADLHAHSAAAARALPAGDDLQLVHVRAAVSAAAEGDALLAWLDGGGLPEGVVLDADLRWHLVGQLAALGAVDAARVAEERERDRTAAGEQSAARALAALPDPTGKEAVWAELLGTGDLSNGRARSLAAGFWQTGQDALLRPYAARYGAEVAGLWERRSEQLATTHRRAAVPAHPRRAGGAGGDRRPHRRRAPRGAAAHGAGAARRAGAGVARPVGLILRASLTRMCGIVGYVGGKPALEVVLDGLRRLEYRGYDSAGVAVLDGAPAGGAQGRQARQPREGARRARRCPAASPRPHPLGHPRPAHRPQRPPAGRRRRRRRGGPQRDDREPHGAASPGSRPAATSAAPTPTPRSSPTCSRSGSRRRAATTSPRPCAPSASTSRARSCWWSPSATEPDVVVGARRNLPLVVGVGDGEHFLG